MSTPSAPARGPPRSPLPATVFLPSGTTLQPQILFSASNAFGGVVIWLQCTMSSSKPGAGPYQRAFLSPASFVLFLTTNLLSPASRSAFRGFQRQRTSACVQCIYYVFFVFRRETHGNRTLLFLGVSTLTDCRTNFSHQLFSTQTHALVCLPKLEGHPMMMLMMMTMMRDVTLRPKISANSSHKLEKAHGAQLHLAAFRPILSDSSQGPAGSHEKKQNSGILTPPALLQAP